MRKRGVAEVRAAGIGVEGSVAAYDEDVAVGIGRGATDAHPDASVAAVGSVVVDGCLLSDIGCVIAENPAVIGTDVAVRSPDDPDGAVVEEECRALVLAQGVESDGTSLGSVARPGNAGGDDGGASEFFAAVGEIEGVEALVKGCVATAGEFCFGDDVERAGGAVDDGSSDDAGLRVRIVATVVDSVDDLFAWAYKLLAEKVALSGSYCCRRRGRRCWRGRWMRRRHCGRRRRT